ncbi:MAG: hypothetical protein HUK00_09260 [Bacteroidaceae bacterium]|nr:hypothetical protein [Bacteroidaceae bacterium]
MKKIYIIPTTTVVAIQGRYILSGSFHTDIDKNETVDGNDSDFTIGVRRQWTHACRQEFWAASQTEEDMW